ncbi:MAG: four helix bundle protein [Vicinamibacterales bacterium]
MLIEPFGIGIAPRRCMSRDPNKLRVFAQADDLVPGVYTLTRLLPDAERYGLQSQIRRAAVSAPTNIVEGCARRSEKAYLNFLEVALGSASEVRYLLGLAVRLEFLPTAEANALAEHYTAVIKGLQKLIDSLSPHQEA